MPTSINVNATDEVLKYIDDMPDFAKAICMKLRNIILNADPGIKEDWKWGPNYNLNGMLCGFGGFQKHVKFTFYNGSAMRDPANLFNHCVDNEFNRSIKYTRLEEINEKLLTDYVRESIQVNKKGFKREVKNKSIDIPEDLKLAIKKKKKAADFFENLSYGYQKEFIEWITSAKREETRQDRINKTIVKCGEHKRLNDKYKT